jgi:alpha-beta hydrolase superfamily lysophospholipase
MVAPDRFSVQRPDGVPLTIWDWPAPAAPRGQVVLVHGLGEHARRYDAVAARLARWGWAVRGFDQRGHGTSGGHRGCLPSTDALLDDLDAVLAHTRQGGQGHTPVAGPLVLIGHSMGGLVAAAACWRACERGASAPDGLPDALVLSSPALDVGMAPPLLWLVAVLNRVAPQRALSNGLLADKISHDPVVVAAYRQDPLVHDRISAPLAAFFHAWGKKVRAAGARWPVPTLLLYAEADHLVRPAGSVAFARAAAAAGAPVQAQGFAGLYHEIFNEPEAMAAPVWQRLQTWLQALRS